MLGTEKLFKSVYCEEQEIKNPNFKDKIDIRTQCFYEYGLGLAIHTSIAYDINQNIIDKQVFFLERYTTDAIAIRSAIAFHDAYYKRMLTTFPH